MACEYSVAGGLVNARTTGVIGAEERLEILGRIMKTYDSAEADAVVVDHLMSQISCSQEESKLFGKAINLSFADRQPCFIAVLVNRLCFSKMRLVDASIECAHSINGRSLIRSYFDADFMMQYLQLWREQLNSRYADVSWV